MANSCPGATNRQFNSLDEHLFARAMNIYSRPMNICSGHDNACRVFAEESATNLRKACRMQAVPGHRPYQCRDFFRLRINCSVRVALVRTTGGGKYLPSLTSFVGP